MRNLAMDAIDVWLLVTNVRTLGDVEYGMGWEDRRDGVGGGVVKGWGSTNGVKLWLTLTPHRAQGTWRAS